MFFEFPSLKLTVRPWKWMVGILFCFLLGWPIFRCVWRGVSGISWVWNLSLLNVVSNSKIPKFLEKSTLTSWKNSISVIKKGLKHNLTPITYNHPLDSFIFIYEFQAVPESNVSRSRGWPWRASFVPEVEDSSSILRNDHPRHHTNPWFQERGLQRSSEKVHFESISKRCRVHRNCWWKRLSLVENCHI